MLKRCDKLIHRDRMWIPVMIFLAGTVFLFTGINRGEMGVVLRKAIHICLECIGIG